MWSIAIAALSLSAGNQTQPVGSLRQDEKSIVDQCLEILQGHEQVTSRILLRYRSVRHAEAEEALAKWREEGVWLRYDDRYGVVAIGGMTARPPTYERGAWTGEYGFHIRGQAEWGNLDPLFHNSEEKSMEALKNLARHPGPLARTEMPAELGLCFINTPWSRYLRGMKNLRPAGRDMVIGKDCQVLTFEMEQGTANNSTLYPWRVFVDDRDTQLVLRAESFVADPAPIQGVSAAAPSHGVQIQLEGLYYSRLYHAEVTRVYKMADDVSLGMDGFVGYEDDPSGVMHITLIPDGCRRATQDDLWMISPPHCDGMKVLDSASNSVSYLGHESELEYEPNRRLYDLLAITVDPAYAEEYGYLSSMRTPISTADPVDVAAFAAYWLAGEKPSFENVRQLGPKTFMHPIALEDLPQMEWAVAYRPSVQGKQSSSPVVVRRNGTTIDYVLVSTMQMTQTDQIKWKTRRAEYTVYRLPVLHGSKMVGQAKVAAGVAALLSLLVGVALCFAAKKRRRIVSIEIEGGNER